MAHFWEPSDCRANMCYGVYNIPRRLFNYSVPGMFHTLIPRARVRDPGILITLPWHGHIHQVSNKIHRALRYLKFNKDLLSKQRHSYFTRALFFFPSPYSFPLAPLVFSRVSRWIKNKAIHAVRCVCRIDEVVSSALRGWIYDGDGGRREGGLLLFRRRLVIIAWKSRSAEERSGFNLFQCFRRPDARMFPSISRI